MTDNDIIRFAQMPKFSQTQTDYVLAVEALDPITDILNELSSSCEKLELFNTAYKKISRHGVTDFIKEEFGDALSPFSVNFETQSVSACLEGLSSLAERAWTIIRNMFVRLFEYLTTNTYFGNLFNRSEFYRRRMSEIIAGPLRGYVKADLDSFNSITISGFNYNEFYNRMNYTGMLISKLRNIASYRMETIDVEHMFADVIRYLNINTESGTFYPSVPVMSKGTTYDLGWTPFKVYSVSSNLYSKVAVNSIGLSRLQQEFARSLKVAIAECDAILAGRIDGNDENKVLLARKKIQNIRNVQALVQIANNNMCYLCGQWIRMAQFDTGARPYPA